MADEVLGRISAEVTLDPSNVSQGVKVINRNMRLLKSQFDSAGGGVKAFGASQEQLGMKARFLERQIEQQKDKVKLLSQAYKQYENEAGAGARRTQEMGIQANKARAHLGRLEHQLNEVNRQMDFGQLNNSMGQLDREMRLIEARFKLAGAGVKGFEQSTEGMRVKASSLTDQIRVQERRVQELTAAYNRSATAIGREARETQELQIRMNQAQAGLLGYRSQLSRVNRDLEKQGSAVGRLRNHYGRLKGQALDASMGLATGAAGMAVAIGSAVKKAADFEEQLSSVKAVTGATSEEMAQFKALSIEMGAKTKYSASEAAQGIEELAKAGLSTSQILNGGLKGALNLAAAGELELGEAAEIASTALNSFKSENLSVSQAADILAGAANASATDIHEMKEGLSQVAAVASGAGLSFNDTSTALAVFAQNGLKGSDAGTSLKTMLLNLTPSSKQAGEQMKQLGIITEDNKNLFYDSEGEVKSFGEISEVLSEKLKNLSNEQRSQALKTMFGTDAIRAANIAYKEGSQGVEKMNEAMGKTTAAKVATERMDNLKGTLEELNGAFETAQIEMGSAFLPVLRNLASGIQETAQWFSQLSPSTKEAIGIFTLATAGTLALGAAITGLIAIMNPVTASIAGVSLVVGGLAAVNHKMSADMEKTQADAQRFGVGVSQGTIKAAEGYLDLRDQAAINLAKLRITSGAEAKKIVAETTHIFNQMGNKIVAELEKGRAAVQTAAASLMGELPKELNPRVEQITNNTIRRIDAEKRAMIEATDVINEGLTKYQNNLDKMPKSFAKAFQEALDHTDKASRVFVKNMSDMQSYMKNIEEDRGKLSEAAAKKWVADTEKSYDKAVKAAHKWAEHQKKISKDELNDGKRTREEYDEMVKFIQLAEVKKVDAARESRARVLEEVRKSLSEEAKLYDYKNNKEYDPFENSFKGMPTETAAQRKAATDAYFKAQIDQYKEGHKKLKKLNQELTAEYGNMGTDSISALNDALAAGGKKSQRIAETIATDTKDGMKIDLGPEGEVSIKKFTEGLKSGQFSSRDVSIAHMQQLRNIYGDGDFTAEGIKAIESFANGLKGKSTKEIADQIGLDLKSKMDIDLGPYGKVSAESFAQGLSDGTYSFDAIYDYFQQQLKAGMEVDLSPEGKKNIGTLRLAMQSGAMDLRNTAKILGLNLKSGVKVDLGPEGKQSVQSLLTGFATGKINAKTFAEGVAKLLKKGARADLTSEGKHAGNTLGQGLNQSKGKVGKEASGIKSIVENRLGATTDGSGGKTAGSLLYKGLAGRYPGIKSIAGIISKSTQGTLGKTTDGGGGKKASGQFSSGVAGGRGSAARAASGVSSAARSNLNVSNTYSLGSNAAAGLASGIRGGRWGVIRAAASLAHSVWSTISNTLDIHSPSRKTMQLGIYTGQGFEEGLSQRVSNVQRVSERLSRAAAPVVALGQGSSEKLSMSRSTSSGGSNTVTKNYNISIQTDLSSSINIEEVVTRAIRRIEFLNG
ncbi:phage tail tape measure protein [Marininema halotolerans]|uniref:Phage tail tape measure protein, TP901 family, core region n=1 Tax=Marininema halotolerans TaxID=1155944 RepID=A0A1I6URJ1_9BACL|nr:phage tail tape measure protein [Marininema halotolerans]SFT04065.1 phage tail tape measure protein, TP901 family, core region [Marininema halotolerans]